MQEKKATAYVFLDTNLHLHFKDFDQIDWPSVLLYKKVCLVFAPINFDELEKFKYDRDSERRQKRSRAITKKIDEIMFSVAPGKDASIPGRSDVSMQFLTDSPNISLYSGLQAYSNDDHLVASILKFIDDNPTIDRDDVILVSEDSGILNKARVRNITICRIDEKFRLPDEPTTDKQKIAKLERELAEIKKKEPMLDLAFVKDDYPEEELCFHIDIISDARPEEIDRLCEVEAQAIEWFPSNELNSSESMSQKNMPAGEKDPLAASLSASIKSLQDQIRSFSPLSIPQTEIERYKKEKDEYLLSYREYLLESVYWEQIKQQVRRIDLQIVNRGTSAATGLVVKVIFPDELKVQNWEVLPDKPEKPVRPQKPMTELARVVQSFVQPLQSGPLSRDLLASLNFTNPNYINDPDSAEPLITPYNSTLVQWERSKVLHHLPLKLTPLLVLFPAIEGKQEFQIKYEIYADNIASPVNGELRILFDANRKNYGF